jgi:hypothetical protein
MHLGLLVALAIARPPAADAHGIPRGPTPVTKLTTKALQHHEVLRINRDFGMAQWEIVLDGWLPRDVDGHVEHVRLWWVNNQDRARRKPVCAHLRRYIDFGYERADAGRLAVRMAGDRKEYLFSVEIDPSGVPAVFADVELADGSTVPRCRCDEGRLIARRVLGIPIGIAALTVTCTDPTGTRRDGKVPYRVLSTGKDYSPQ